MDLVIKKVWAVADDSSRFSRTPMPPRTTTSELKSRPMPRRMPSRWTLFLWNLPTTLLTMTPPKGAL